LGEPVAELTRATILKLFKVNDVEALLVIEKVYHLLAAMFVASVPLNPEPEILPPAVAHVTPLPLEICENVIPAGGAEIVAVGVAGQVILVIAV
jgi:hypothetical protein